MPFTVLEFEDPSHAAQVTLAEAEVPVLVPLEVELEVASGVLTVLDVDDPLQALQLAELVASGVLTELKVDAPFQALQVAEVVATDVVDDTLVLEVLELDVLALETHTADVVVPMAQTGVGLALIVVQLEVIG